MSPHSNYNFLEEYSGFIALSLVSVTMLYNVHLIFKIKYGSVMITKVCLLPYYYALANLTIGGVNTLLKCIVIWQNPSDDKSKADLNIWNNVDANWLVAIIRVLDSAEILCFIQFIGERAYIISIFYEFMVYQSKFRLEDLDIAKDYFNRIERQAHKLYFRVFRAYFVTVMGLTVINCVVLIHWQPQYVSIAYTGLQLAGYLVILRLYLFARIQYYRYMKQKHYDAYMSHRL